MCFKEYEKNMSFLDMEQNKTLGISRTERGLKERSIPCVQHQASIPCVVRKTVPVHVT